MPKRHTWPLQRPEPVAPQQAPKPVTLLARSLHVSSVFFFVAFVWHSSLLPVFYNFVGPTIGAAITFSGSHVDAFKDPTVLSAETLRQFGFAGAAAHTVIFLFGFLCAVALRTVRFGSLVQTKSGRPDPVGIGVSLVLVVWTAAVFHVIALTFSKYAFETKFGPVYSYATIFFENTGESPFAWASSVSFTTALILGFLVSTDTQVSRASRIVLGPFYSSLGATGLASVLVPFAIWVGMLDAFLIPIGSAAIKSEGLKDSVLDGSHAFAFAIGLLMMCAGSATRIFAETCCAPDGSTDGDAARDEYSQTLDSSNFVTILQTLAATIVLSSSLMLSALLKGEVAAGAIWANMWRPALVSVLFVGMAILAPRLVRRYKWDIAGYVLSTKGIQRRFWTYLIIFCLWNCHLLPFVGCWVPFHVFATFKESHIRYSHLDALWDGFVYSFTGPYLAPVVVQGIIKIMSARFKLKWGLAQETFLALLVLLPPTVVVYYKWQEQHVTLPIQLFMSLMELYYLLSFRGRPEYTGWREWKELKTSAIWVLLEEYFTPRIIVDGLMDSDKDARVGHVDGFEPGVARVIGFHPHGLFPCTLIWSTLIPLWAQVFGPELQAYPLTDALTHCPPGMREVMQWHGCREITKAVMLGMLRDKKTVIVVPGGQAEMLRHTSESFKEKKMVLDGKHRGFVRVALTAGAQLVPMISFGELHAVKNVELPTIQRITRKIYGIPIPFLPVGVWGVLPFPRRVKFTLVYGQPLSFPVATPGEPTDDEVDVAYQAYFDEVNRLFYAYRATAGYPDWTLHLLRGLERRPSGTMRDE